MKIILRLGKWFIKVITKKFTIIWFRNNLIINILNNDYDEAVIDANWGLGESVVAGMVSPDHFVVDKVSQKIIEKHLGGKETAVFLTPHGGIEERPSNSAAID